MQNRMKAQSKHINHLHWNLPLELDNMPMKSPDSLDEAADMSGQYLFLSGRHEAVNDWGPVALLNGGISF